MKIQIENALQNYAQKTYLALSADQGGTVLYVQNIAGAVASNAIQIGDKGIERTETKLLGTATPSGTTLILSSALSFDHIEDTPVYFTQYDKLVFMRSTTGTSGTATAITSGTVSITPDSDYTTFEDSTGQSTYAYKTKYRNSVTTDESAESDWIIPGGYSFYSLARIRERIKRKLYASKIVKDDTYIDDWVNEWLEEMTNAAIRVNEDYRMGTAHITFGTNGRGTISEVDYQKTRMVEITFDGSSYFESTKLPIIRIESAGTYIKESPVHYYEDDNIIHVKPEGNGGTINLTYYKKTPVLENETDELPVSIRPYTRSFVHYGYAQALKVDEKFEQANIEEGKADALKGEFIAEISPRDQSGGETIELLEEVDHLYDYDTYDSI